MQAFIWQKNYTWDLNNCVSYVLQVLQLSRKYRNGFTSENLLRVFGENIWQIASAGAKCLLSNIRRKSTRIVVHCFRTKCRLSSFIWWKIVKRKTYIHNWPSIHHVRWSFVFSLTSKNTCGWFVETKVFSLSTFYNMISKSHHCPMFSLIEGL